jgi:hypothetical protein
VGFAAITPCVASRPVFIVVFVYFVIDSVRKLLDTPSQISTSIYTPFHDFLTDIPHSSYFYHFLQVTDCEGLREMRELTKNLNYL